jgi:hypothetical protein
MLEAVLHGGNCQPRRVGRKGKMESLAGNAAEENCRKALSPGHSQQLRR